MPVVGAGRMARKTESGNPPDALFSRRLHAPRTSRGYCLPEQRSRLRHSVPSHGRDLVHHRCRSPTSGRRDRFLRGTSQLGTESAFSSPPALCRSGWRDLARQYPLDSLPPQFLLARTGAVLPVPPIVLDLSAGGLRRRQTQLLFFSRGPARSPGVPPLSRSAARPEMGGLRQTALRRTSASGRLPGPLHPPSCDFQPSTAGYRRRTSAIPMAGLS